MIALIVGITLASVIAAGGRITRFDMDRGFYATVLIVIASYYVLFAFIAQQAILPEAIAASLFSAIAVLGAYRWMPLIGIGILLHGVFDLIHPFIIDNPGVPLWWPAFCGGVDIVLGAWVIYITLNGKTLTQRDDLSSQ